MKLLTNIRQFFNFDVDLDELQKILDDLEVHTVYTPDFDDVHLVRDVWKFGVPNRFGLYYMDCEDTSLTIGKRLFKSKRKFFLALALGKVQMPLLAWPAITGKTTYHTGLWIKQHSLYVDNAHCFIYQVSLSPGDLVHVRTREYTVQKVFGVFSIMRKVWRGRNG